MSETKVTAKFPRHGETQEAEVLNPGAYDGHCHLFEVCLGYSSVAYIVEARGASDAVDEFSGDERTRHHVLIDESDYADYGSCLSAGDMAFGRKIEQDGFYNLKGERVEKELQEPYWNDGGEPCNLDGLHMEEVDSEKVRYFGIYQGVHLPEGGVLAKNLARWYEESQKEPDTRSVRDRRLEDNVSDLLQLRGTIRGIFAEALRRHLTFHEILEERGRFNNLSKVKRLPHRFEEELRHYFEGYLDAYGEFNTESVWQAGEQRYTHETRPKTQDWSKTRYLGRFYKGTDKPYYLNEEKTP